MSFKTKSHTERAPKSLLSLFVIALSLTAVESLADDLVIVAERSKGVEVSGGDKDLSPSDSLTLAAKGRLWAVKEGSDASFNVICMNQSQETLTLTQNDTAPWLQTSDGSCSEKAPNVYSCGNASKPALMCRTQTIANKSGGGDVTDMTAVALRSLDSSDEAFYRIANSVMEQHKLHFDLCQDMHGKHAQGGISFVIQASGAVEEVNVIQTGELATPQRATSYAQCMAQAIELWRFPTLDYIYEMEYAFVN